MKSRHLLLLIVSALITACGLGGSGRVPSAELPDPLIYALTIHELPEVGLSWVQTYNQSEAGQGYKRAYTAYQAYQPGSLGGELESGFAVNNDVVLYETDVSREALPGPSRSMGGIQDITWKNAAQARQVGDKSGAWKTAVGDLLTPAWELEFYQGHAYVRIS